MLIFRKPDIHTFVQYQEGVIRILKTTRFAAYIGYVILVVFVLKLLFQYEHILQEQSKVTFDYFSSLLYSSLYPLLIGLLFALPKFIQALKGEGRWNFDWLKFTAIGLPALFGAAVFLIYFSPIGKYLPPMLIGIFGTKFSTICGIVFGYLALSCFQKSKVNS